MKLAIVAIAAALAYILYGNLLVYGQEDFETYTNKDFNFSINYPQDWNAEERDLQPAQVVRFSYTDYPSVVVISVFILDVSETRSNETLHEMVEKGLEYAGINVRLISMTNTTLSGLPAIEKVYYQYDNDVTGKSKEIVAFNDNDLVTLFYTSPPGDYNEYIPIFDQMVQSFKLGINE
jgi:PsbP-like protein